MSQSVELKTIWKMLDECVPGYSASEGDHYWRIFHPDGKRVFPTLPTGAHGSGRPKAEIGHVRQLVRLFEIPVEDAAEFIPQLTSNKKKKKK